MKIRTLLASAAILGACLAAGAAGAQNLVNNGGFETGDFSGWSPGGGAVQNAVACGSCVHAGAFGASFSGEQMSPLGQSLATMAGATYTVSFWLNRLGEMPNSVSLTWDGQVIFSQSDSPGGGWVQHTFTETASSDSTVLSFGLGPGASALDDISVTQAVPEPATWAMMLTGFLGAGAALRSRRRAAVAA